MRLALLAATFAAFGFVLTSIPAADAAATRFFDPLTRTWIEVAPGRSQRNPVPRETVAYDGSQAPGTIIVNTTERRLYYVLEDGVAIRYGVGVGREGFQWSGSHRVTRKAEWPRWTPPPQMIRRRPELAAYASGMPGGPDNPLGARALYIGSTLYRIHGSNEPWSIGQAVSSGCIRMANDDVIHLYEQVGVGAKVVVVR